MTMNMGGGLRNHVIIGSGAAGFNAALALRRLAPGDSVTIVSDEQYPYYSRVLTANVVSGDVEEERLFLARPKTYADLGISLLSGRSVQTVDADGRRVSLDDGQTLEYDTLLLATGAVPQRLGVPGEGLPGVFTLRTLDDALAVRRRLLRHRLRTDLAAEGSEVRPFSAEAGPSSRPQTRAVVVGGGMVGMKATEAFLKRGLAVDLVISSGRVLSQAMEAEGAELVAVLLREEGVVIHFHEDIASIEGNHTEGVTSVTLKSGTRIPCDIVVVAKGVSPRAELARQIPGVRVNRGVVVDRFLGTGLPGVYAAGDVAEAWDIARGVARVNAIWPNAVEQGRVAGINMARAALAGGAAGVGCGRQAYRGAMAMNSLQIGRVPVMAMGFSNPPVDAEGVQGASWFSRDRSAYRRLVFERGVLVGAVLIGDTEGAGLLRWLIATGRASYAMARDLLAQRLTPGRVAMALTGRHFPAGLWVGPRGPR